MHKWKNASVLIKTNNKKAALRDSKWNAVIKRFPPHHTQFNIYEPVKSVLFFYLGKFEMCFLGSWVKLMQFKSSKILKRHQNKTSITLKEGGKVQGQE